MTINFKKMIKSIPLVNNLARKINNILVRYMIRKSLKEKLSKKKDEGRIFVFLCDTHGNLGDVALRYAQRSFLNKYFDDIFTISDRELRYGKDIIRENINDLDVLTMVGGGNIGNQYMGPENDRRFLIENFPKNKIISFPQTIYFTKDDIGEREQRKTVEIYEKHPNLTIFSRDIVSYEIAKSLFKNVELILTPDIVLNLTEFKYNFNRKGALFLTRADVEKTLTDQDFENLKYTVGIHFNDVIYSDTVIPRDVALEDQFEILDEKLRQIAQAKVVVTDRLHGMIFCAITNTPCIVISNYNHKIKYQYEWIKHLNFVRYLDDISEFDKVLSELLIVEPTSYNNDFTIPYFSQILDSINKERYISGI